MNKGGRGSSDHVNPMKREKIKDHPNKSKTYKVCYSTGNKDIQIYYLTGYKDKKGLKVTKPRQHSNA